MKINTIENMSAESFKYLALVGKCKKKKLCILIFSHIFLP